MLDWRSSYTITVAWFITQDFIYLFRHRFFIQSFTSSRRKITNSNKVMTLTPISRPSWPPTSAKNSSIPQEYTVVCVWTLSFVVYRHYSHFHIIGVRICSGCVCCRYDFKSSMLACCFTWLRWCAKESCNTIKQWSWLYVQRGYCSLLERQSADKTQPHSLIDKLTKLSFRQPV